jgi:hypothetical protein
MRLATRRKSLMAEMSVEGENLPVAVSGEDLAGANQFAEALMYSSYLARRTRAIMLWYGFQ